MVEPIEPIAHHGDLCYGKTPGGTILVRPAAAPPCPGRHWRYLPGQKIPADATPGRRIVASSPAAGSLPGIAGQTPRQRDALTRGWWDNLPWQSRRLLRERVLANSGARSGPLVLAALCQRLAAELSLSAPPGVRWSLIGRLMLSRGFGDQKAPAPPRPCPAPDRTPPEGARARLRPLALAAARSLANAEPIDATRQDAS